ncbi:chemotaxis protein CheB [Parendozoicomonas haliclonae]|uniref:protein-glutamate methylesterase n=1 Tax=Parendozoicomonas haliclonae TaxID=1960125 RepID=A0A1X7AJ14_9GAMM|nr:chemotaxis protein CheB [Parendozoicomonas haliclonae]SMA46078.1 Chemotaxis response regulator protein-glutamate methylesterase of group 1 operon [Parendozoicomonas haliclonae]
MTDKRRGIGIIADRTLVRQRLRETLEQQGFYVVANTPPKGCSDKLLASPLVRAWIVDLEKEEDHGELLDRLVEVPSVPVFFDMGLPGGLQSVEYAHWVRRLTRKLREFREPATLDSDANRSAETSNSHKGNVVTWPIRSTQEKESEYPKVPAERVWVLGASLGGPHSVKEFLDHLPDGLPVAFVYAQHIDQEFASILASTVARHSYCEVVEAKSGQVLHNGEVLFTPIEKKIEFDSRHRVQILDESWSGVYCPNIDEVMLAVRQGWPGTCGALIFSGMGKDGSFEARVFKQHNLPVWVQTPEDCASSVMPEAIIEAESATCQGTPRELAAKLVEYITAEAAKDKARSSQTLIRSDSNV